MKLTDEQMLEVFEAYNPDFTSHSAATRRWTEEHVGPAVAKVLSFVAPRLQELSAAIDGQLTELRAERDEALRRVEYVHEMLGERERAAADLADGVVEPATDVHNTQYWKGQYESAEEECTSERERAEKALADLADVKAQAEHAEKLLSVYDHTELEAAMACLESIASYVGANGQTAPHTVEELDQRIRGEIDALHQSFNLEVDARREQLKVLQERTGRLAVADKALALIHLAGEAADQRFNDCRGTDAQCVEILTAFHDAVVAAVEAVTCAGTIGDLRNCPPEMLQALAVDGVVSINMLTPEQAAPLPDPEDPNTNLFAQMDMLANQAPQKSTVARVGGFRPYQPKCWACGAYEPCEKHAGLLPPSEPSEVDLIKAAIRVVGTALLGAAPSSYSNTVLTADQKHAVSEALKTLGGDL